MQNLSNNLGASSSGIGASRTTHASVPLNNLGAVAYTLILVVTLGLPTSFKVDYAQRATIAAAVGGPKPTRCYRAERFAVGNGQVKESTHPLTAANLML